MMFSAQDYETLHGLVFQPKYPGYRPAIKEMPNGDGKVDTEKRYAHVATKYLDNYTGPGRGTMFEYLYKAHESALSVARALSVPGRFHPRVESCALRVLEYPAGAGSALHTDFDLFTLLMYRDQSEKLRLFDGGRDPWELDDISKGLHIGEIGELVGLGAATAHDVLPSERPQHSIVYFAIPDHAAVLPTGKAVGDWIAERIARSRTY